MADGVRVRNASADSSSDARPANGEALITPPMRFSDSKMVTRGAFGSLRMRNAAERPVIPAPITTTCLSFMPVRRQPLVLQVQSLLVHCH